MQRMTIVLASLAGCLAVVGTANAQTCPCDCYFSGDCNPGQFCDYGNLSIEDSCFWRQPKPFGSVGAGCQDVFNDWGQCDGICTGNAQTQIFSFEEPSMLMEAVALWGEAFTVSAAQGGGSPLPELVAQIRNMPWSDEKSANRTGKVVVELMILTLGEKSVVFPGFEGFQSEDMQILDLSDDFCRIQTGNAAISALLGEMRGAGMGADAFDMMRIDCLDQRMLARVCSGFDTGDCLYTRIQDFAQVLTRSGREDATDSGNGATASGGLCGECVNDADCDDDNPCTADDCIEATGACDFQPTIPPCDGNGCNDCNNNGLDDFCEDTSDCNGNDIPDECEANPQCSSDSCEGATPICNVTNISGTTVGATNDGFSSCGISGSSPDKWYVYSPTSSGSMTADLCGSNYDTVLAIHDSCPGVNSQQLACNDDSCSVQSSVTINVTAGQDYYIRVTGYSNSVGNYLLTVDGPECESPLSPPVVEAMGSRYLSITPASDLRPVALQVTSATYACVNKFVDATGTLTDTPVYQTSAEWGTVMIADESIVPGTSYSVTAVTSGLVASPAASTETWQWADANQNGVANFEDVLLVVLGFQQNWELVTLESTDIEPCTTNGIANLADVNLAVGAFRGDDFPCTLPCQ
ncbi:MAG: hypothetical protein ACPGXK_01935 [Phycisphaerae bacterium]